VRDVTDTALRGETGSGVEWLAERLPRPSTSSGASRSDSGIMLVALVLLALALGGLTIRARPHFSYIDEIQHFDYAVRLSRGQLPRVGDPISDAVLRRMACRGIDISPADYEQFYEQPYDLPTCGEPVLDPARFPERGVNHAAIHPPAYYAVTGVLGRVLQTMTPIGDPLTADRAASLLWLVIALVLVWYLAQEVGLVGWGRVAAVSLLATAPAILLAVSAVGPDATAFATGAGMLLTVMRWEAGRARIWVVSVVAAAAVILRETSLLALGACVLYLAVRALQSERGDPSRKRAVIGVVSLILGAILASTAWLVARASLDRVPVEHLPIFARLHVPSLGGEEILGEFHATLSPVRLLYPPRSFWRTGVALANGLLDLLLVAGAAAAAMLGRSRTRETALGGAALSSMLLGGPILVVANFLLLRIFVPIPPRYGYPLVPVALASMAPILNRRAGAIAVGGLAVLSAISMLTATLG
jgi:hypothetical protein